MKKKIILIFVFLLVIILSGIGFNYYRISGDMLLDYLADCMNIKMKYDGSCDFSKAFVFKTTTLNNVKIYVDGTPITLSADSAQISFSYEYLLSHKGVMLSCIFNNVNVASAITESDEPISKLIPQELRTLFDDEGNLHMDEILCDILLYDIYADFKTLRLLSKDIVIDAAGIFSDNGMIDVRINVDISPKINDRLPENIKAFIIQSENGWGIMDIKIKNDPAKQYLSIDSPTLKFTMGNPE